MNFLYSFPQFASGSAQVLQTIQRSFQPVEIRAILSCTDDDATETGSSRVIDMIYSRRDMTDYAGFNAKCASAVGMFFVVFLFKMRCCPCMFVIVSAFILDVPITATDVDRYHMHLATWDRQAFASVANE